MAMIATDIKGLLKIDIKSRSDGYSDQYNRIFMIKLLLVSSIVMGVSWFQDSISCVVPDHHEIDGKFVSATCWIQGVYVYKELKNRSDDLAYYGIPKDMANNGMLENTTFLCNTKKKLSPYINKKCVEMEKTFFLQYQWLPFLIASLSIMFYIPYVFHRTVNNDLISLKKAIKEKEPDAGMIAKHYFSRENPRGPNCLKILGNLLIKLLYIGVNVGIFVAFHYLLNEEFYYYGVHWLKWSKYNNTMQYDYMGMRDTPKPGNHLLPPFGYCELYQSASDVKTTSVNKHKLLCELSQNILYQYCFIVLWCALLIGMCLSALGFLYLLGHYLYGICIRARFQTKRRLYGVKLSFRELEYLDFIKSRNLAIHGEILEKIGT